MSLKGFLYDIIVNLVSEKNTYDAFNSYFLSTLMNNKGDMTGAVFDNKKRNFVTVNFSWVGGNSKSKPHFYL